MRALQKIVECKQLMPDKTIFFLHCDRRSPAASLGGIKVPSFTAVMYTVWFS